MLWKNGSRTGLWNLIPTSVKQSQIQDFPKEGARFRVKCHVDAIQWGGGGSSRIFPCSPKAYAIQWGGG